ncbi:MAG: hypothetical protein KDI46_05800 [Alphaproteobacteria bacterium]|nr:hypothetical protein [Alphaproteobacteria bacterium]
MGFDPAKTQLLDTFETRKFIEAVRDERFAALFDGPSYGLWATELSFLDGYSHYVLANKAVIPYFTLDYISNGSDHYFLDGSEHTLELLCNRGALCLSEDNIFDYLQFFSDMAFYPHRKVKFITDPTHAPYGGAAAMGHHFKALKYHADSSVYYDVGKEAFEVVMPVLYNGETVKGHVQVKKDGEITLLEPVNVPLMDRTRDHVPLDYDHLAEKELLEQNIGVLTLSEEGKRLWETIQNYGGHIRFVSGVGYNAIATSAQEAFVIAPENLRAYSPYQLIAIIGVLRDMELQLMGEMRGDPFGDGGEFTEKNCAINLDILLKICTIGDELAEQGYEEVLDRFKRAGFGKIYSGYKNDMDLEYMAELLAEHLGIEVAEE